jgi:hypothetical protein
VPQEFSETIACHNFVVIMCPRFYSIFIQPFSGVKFQQNLSVFSEKSYSPSMLICAQVITEWVEMTLSNCSFFLVYGRGRCSKRKPQKFLRFTLRTPSHVPLYIVTFRQMAKSDLMPKNCLFPNFPLRFSFLCTV